MRPRRLGRSSPDEQTTITWSGPTAVVVHGTDHVDIHHDERCVTVTWTSPRRPASTSRSMRRTVRRAGIGIDIGNRGTGHRPARRSVTIRDWSLQVTGDPSRDGGSVVVYAGRVADAILVRVYDRTGPVASIPVDVVVDTLLATLSSGTGAPIAGLSRQRAPRRRR